MNEIYFKMSDEQHIGTAGFLPFCGFMLLNRETKESNTFYVSETQLQAGTVRQQFQVQLLW